MKLYMHIFLLSHATYTHTHAHANQETPDRMFVAWQTSSGQTPTGRQADKADRSPHRHTPAETVWRESSGGPGIAAAIFVFALHPPPITLSLDSHYLWVADGFL